MDGRTNNHGGEGKALPDALAMNLVGQTGEADVAHKFFANDTYAVGLWVRGNGRSRAIGKTCGCVAVAGRDVGVGHLGRRCEERRKRRGKRKNH